MGKIQLLWQKLDHSWINYSFKYILHLFHQGFALITPAHVYLFFAAFCIKEQYTN